MKKIFFVFLLIAAGWSLNAQVTVYRASDNTVYTVPTYIKTNFEATYPGVIVVAWEPVNTFWRANYIKDNRVIYVYYTESGVNYKAALPVVQNNVPEEVINTALNVYGPIVYGITKIRAANDTDVYQLRLLENGTTRTAWMGSDGKVVTDVYKVKIDDGEIKVKQE